MLLDLSVLRGGQGREAALLQLAVALGRAWAVYHRPGLTWGYVLYDSASSTLLLRPRLQRTAAALSESAQRGAVTVGGA